jgi:hypothetical protein
VRILRPQDDDERGYRTSAKRATDASRAKCEGAKVNRNALDLLLKSRRSDPDWSQSHETLAALAATLADTLDAGAGMAVAAVSRELRATLEALAPKEGTDAFDRLAAELSASVEYRAD